MEQKIQKTSFIAATKSFIASHWRSMTVGFLFGAVLGLASPTVIQGAVLLWEKANIIIYKYCGDITLWPKHGTTTLLAITFAAFIFYVFRLSTFLKRIWLSWQAGLFSGVGLLWFLTSTITFSFLSIKASVFSWVGLGAGMALTCLFVRRDLRLEGKKAVSSETDPDNAISTSAEDIIGRGSVVAGLIRAVDDHTPIIALTGPLGEGKTSVLNLLSEKLEPRNDVVVVRFSTWLPMDEKTLLTTLFSAVLAKLETKLFIPGIKKDFNAVTRLFFSVLPKIPAPIMELVDKPTQDQQLNELRLNLSKLPIRVVIFLDDVDRMQRKELELLFKLLRGVPEFPQFTYICAFDRIYLTQMLCSDTWIKSQKEAERFLEKFFPDEISLPKIEPARLAVEFENRFYATFDRNNVITEPLERQTFQDDFRTLWQMQLKRYFSNLRRVKLFINRLNRPFPLIKQEVNLRDFVLLEIIRMINPVLYEEIYRNYRYFIFARWRSTAWLDIIHPDEEEERNAQKKHFDELFHDLRRPPDGIELALLEEIFPTVKSYLNNGGLGRSQDPNEAERQRRVYHPDFFPRYFIFDVPSDQFGEKEISIFINNMNGVHDTTQSAILFKDRYESLKELPMKRWDFFRRVDLSIAHFNPTALQGLVDGIGDISEQLDMQGASFDQIRGTRIVIHAAHQIYITKGSRDVLEKFIGNAASDFFATEVLNESRSDRTQWLTDKAIFDMEKLELAFRERMNSRYGPDGKFSFFPKDRKANITPLGRWAYCGPEGKQAVHDYLTREFESEHRNLGRFISYFFPLESAIPGADPLTVIKIYFPPEALASFLVEYGDSSFSTPEEHKAIEEFKLAFNT